MNFEKTGSTTILVGKFTKSMAILLYIIYLSLYAGNIRESVRNYLFNRLICRKFHLLSTKFAVEPKNLIQAKK